MRKRNFGAKLYFGISDFNLIKHCLLKSKPIDPVYDLSNCCAFWGFNYLFILFVLESALLAIQNQPWIPKITYWPLSESLKDSS